MGSEGSTHHYYQPGEGTVPVTSQAKRMGYPFPVYVTRNVWRECISWQGGRNTSSDKRVFELIESCYAGMMKKLAQSDEMVQYEFKHWYWLRSRPKATKQNKIRLGARLLIDFDTEKPWMLVFDPEYDDDRVLIKGEPKDGKPEENRGTSESTGVKRL